MSTSTEGAAKRAAVGLAAVAIVAPQLLGGVLGAAALTIHVFAAIACSWTLYQLLDKDELIRPAPLIVLGAFGAAAWTLLQALPLPCSWVQWTQPERREMIAALLSLGALEAEHCTLSAAPGATRSVLPLAATLASLTIASCAAAHAGGRSILLRGIALSSIAMACVALGHAVGGATTVFGIYTPAHAAPRLLLAPLLNENHLAGHLALGWPLCLSMAFSTRRVDAIIAWLVGALLVLVAGLLSLSRGGSAVMLTAGATFVAFKLARRRSNRTFRFAVLVGSGAVVACGLFAVYDRIVDELGGSGDAATLKLDLVKQLLPSFLLHPVMGIGRAALADVSAHVLEQNVRASYTENFPTQWLIEWGLPCTILLLTVGIVSLLSWQRRRMRDDEVALACGLVGLIVHNLVDFSLELPGVAVVAAISWGCLSARERVWPLLARFNLRSALAVGCGAAVLSIVVGAPWLTRWNRNSLEARLQKVIAEDPRQAAGPLRHALESYPMSPTFVLLGAYAAARAGQPSTGRWLNLAMQTAPGWGAPHRLAAEVLERRGALAQAAIELSLASARDAGRSNIEACSFVRRHPSAELAWAAANDDPTSRPGALEALAACFPHATPELDEFLSRIVERYPDSLRAHTRHVEIALQRGELELALLRAQAAVRARPEAPETVSLLATALLRNGHAIDALRLLERQPPTLRASFALKLVELRTLAELGPNERFTQLLDDLLSRDGRTAAARAIIHATARDLLAAHGEMRRALTHAQAAYDLGQQPPDLEQLHTLAVRVGVFAVALRTASELCQLRHRPEVYCPKSAVTASP